MRLHLPLLLGVLAFSTEAGAQAVPPPDREGLDGHGFSPAPVDGDIRDPLMVHRVGGWSPRQAFISGLFEYAEAPLLWCAQRYNDSTCLIQERLLDDVYALNLNGGYAPTDWLRFYTVVPVFLSTDSDHRPDGGGPGDIRLAGQVALFRGGPLQVGVVPWLDLPTGNEIFFLGDMGVSGGAAVAGSVELDALTLSSDLGVELAPENAFEPNGGDQIQLGLAAGYALADDWGVSLETRINPRLQADAVPGTRIPSEMLYSARHKRPDNGLHFQVGAAHAMSSGPRAAKYRLFLGIGWTQTSSSDLDGDGIVHHLDACPYEAEIFNDWQDGDGCPEEPVFFDVVTHLGGKPVAGVSYEADGAVPNTQPGSFVSSPGRPITIEARYGGCLRGSTKATVSPGMDPLPIDLSVVHGTLRVSLVHADDTPVKNARLLWLNDQGSSPCHPQGEVAVGPHGRLTTVLGATTQRFVVQAPGQGLRVHTATVEQQRTTQVRIVMGPPETRLQPDAIELSDNLWFDYNSITIPPSSRPILEEVAATLLIHPEITKVNVVGHTDAQGTPAFNQTLSIRRAEAVIAKLVAMGVERARLEAVGQGATVPAASNRTAKGRALNRRVELLVQTAPP